MRAGKNDYSFEPNAASLINLSQGALLPKFSKFAYQNFDVTYFRLDRCAKPEHQHPSLQVSVSLNRQPMTAVERKSSGIISKQPMLFGNSCVIPAWQRHTISWDKRSEWVSFHLAPKLIERAARDFGVKSPVEFVSSFCVNDPLLFQLGRSLGAVLRPDDEPLNLYVQSLAGTLVEHLLKSYAADKTNLRQSTGGLAPNKLRRAIEFIDAQLALNVTMEELAASVELSPFHFARAFKESTGLAPHQFIIHRRIEKAKLLLLKNDLSIGEIARRVGYQSHSRFSRLFRQHTNITPQKFRRLF